MRRRFTAGLFRRLAQGASRPRARCFANSQLRSVPRNDDRVIARHGAPADHAASFVACETASISASSTIRRTMFPKMNSWNGSTMYQYA